VGPFGELSQREGNGKLGFSRTRSRTLNELAIETTLYSLDDAPPKPPKRRTGDRQLSLLRVGALVIDDRRELCLIKNVSSGGMLIRAYSPIAEGARLSVELKQGEPVNGTAQWIKDGSIGVSFDTPIDVLSLVSTAMDGPRPRMPRIEICCTAWVREGAAVHRTQAVNISQGGLRIETAAQLPIGAEVIVTLNGLAPEPAVVRWKDEDGYGIAFNRVLSLAQLVAWLQDQRERAQVAN
jgi:hypothetical protein